MEKIDYIVDVQGFYDRHGEFLPKEIAVLGIDCRVFRHWIVKYNVKEHSIINLPVSVLASNTYLTCHHHGLEWYDGESNLNDVYMTLRKITRNALRIYVRGYQKKELLQTMLGRQILNLEEYRCPSFKNLPQGNEHFCTEHAEMKQYFACALAYTYKLRDWLTRSLVFSTEDEVDTPQSKKKSNKKLVKKKAINRVSDSLKKFEINDQTSDRSEGSPCTVITQVAEYEKTDNVYDNVNQDELSADSASANSRGSTNRGGIPRRPDTPAVGETLCSCV